MQIYALKKDKKKMEIIKIKELDSKKEENNIMVEIKE
jgi:hypothetical protein